MENKKMYDYKLNLEDGQSIVYGCEGLFSVNDKQPDSPKLLIKSLEIIDEYFVDADGKRVEETPEVTVEVVVPKKKRKKQ